MRPRCREVTGHRRAHTRVGIGRILIYVVADDVLSLGPLPVVQRLEETHEVGGHGDARAVFGEDSALELVALEKGVRREPHEVELLGWVGPRGCAPRRQNLVPVRITLRPEIRPPRTIQVFELSVALPQPFAERLRRDVAVARGHVAAELVAHVPHRQGGVFRVATRKRLDQAAGSVAIDGTARAVMLACPVPQADPVGKNRKHLRVGVREPRRRRGGRGCEVDANSALVEHLHDPIEPGEVVLARRRFQARPGEDAEGDKVDTGLPHEPDVFLPDALGPLVRVVVATVGDVRQLLAE